MALFPRRYAPFLFSVVQAAVTTGAATAIATHQTTTLGFVFVRYWLSSWGLAWMMMVPVVVAAAPLIHRSVAALTGSSGQQDPS
ncbi:MAG: DUF2798 domain-containing protein [Hyphomicrobiaceae bacterium]|nr:MAG: DUF2798 domain-containing protein [Hyphomicrobiaceae bacterium]